MLTVISYLDRCISAAGGALHLSGFNLRLGNFIIFASNIILLHHELVALIIDKHPYFRTEDEIVQILSPGECHVVFRNSSHLFARTVFSSLESVAELISTFAVELDNHRPPVLYRQLRRLVVLVHCLILLLKEADLVTEDTASD